MKEIRLQQLFKISCRCKCTYFIQLLNIPHAKDKTETISYKQSVIVCMCYMFGCVYSFLSVSD